MNFTGRTHELARLAEIADRQGPALIVVHGRRRVGKTTLVERAFSGRRLLKIEGLEGKSESDQRASAIEQIAHFLETPALAAAKTSSWREVLRILTEALREGERVLFLEEFQWLACYRAELISEIKFFWDNEWSKIPNLVVIICGSSPSFLVGKVVRSKALYSRSLLELPLKPFSLEEVGEFLGPRRTAHEALDAILLVGGIPEYLGYLREGSSIYLSLAKHSFVPGAYFLGEYERILISSMSENAHFRTTLELLSNRRFATRDEIAAHLGISSGKNLTALLEDLEACHFISRVTPYDKQASSKLARYEISDPYVQLFSRAIRPIAAEIEQGRYVDHPQRALSLAKLSQWLGYSFERYCRHNAHRIAQKLGFAAVEYAAGPFFNRATTKTAPGFQLDLVFNRADRVVTVCEVKYTDKPITISQARRAVEACEKLELPRRFRLERVLIAPGGVTPEVASGLFFDRILTLAELVR